MQIQFHADALSVISFEFVSLSLSGLICLQCEYGQQDSQGSGMSFQPGSFRDFNVLQFHEIRLGT